MTEAMNHYCRCGHLDGDHNTEGDYCFKESANGPCPCVRFVTEIATQPEAQHPQEPPTQQFDLEAVTKALRDIADAIRGLTPNAVQDAPGCPQNDPQPEPEQLDGDRGAEDVMGDPGQSRHVMVSRDALDAMGTYRRSAIQRAEKAEAERDAILNELRDLRDATFTDTRHALSKIINRHTPEG